MNERITLLAESCTQSCIDGRGVELNEIDIEKFAELIVRQCIDVIQDYQVPVGNSAAGELAASWTMDALRSIRSEIRETFGVQK